VPTTFAVTTICNHRTNITAELVGSKIKVDMESTCPRIKKYAETLREIRLKEINNLIQEHPIYVKASASHIDPNCLVPCGVAFCAWTEAGMVSKNLLSRYPSQCVTYSSGSV